MTKICSKCGEKKDKSAFNYYSGTSDNLQSYCRECQRKYCREYNYDIVDAQYKLMFESQGGVCAICGQPETKKGSGGKILQSLSIDHSHKTGKIRGLLCRGCNAKLGVLEDIDWRIKADRYLEEAENND